MQPRGASEAAAWRAQVRYLDLRAVWVEGGSERIELGLGEGEADWLVTHTLLGGAIEDVFIQARARARAATLAASLPSPTAPARVRVRAVQVAQFLREHPREVVLLDLQHVRAAPTAEAHAKLLGQARPHLRSTSLRVHADAGAAARGRSRSISRR